MNLKQKLALRSTLVCALTLLFVFAGTYYFFNNYISQQYFTRLDGRALTTAFFFLEKDEMSTHTYRDYEQKYAQSLDEEVVQIYDARDSVTFVEVHPNYPVSQVLLQKIRTTGKENFRVGERQFTGVYYQDNQGDFVILVSGINNRGIEQVQNLRNVLLLFFLVGIALNYLLNILVAQRTFKPFSAILQKVNTISTDNLNARLPVVADSHDELSELTGTLNMFLARLEKEVNNQRMFLKNISHELKTPLTALMGQAELSLESPYTEAQYRQVLQKIVRDTHQIRSIIEGLLLISGLNTGTQRPPSTSFRLDELVWDVLEKLKFKYPGSVIHTSLEVPSAQEARLEIHSHRELLATALLNILDNAVKFSQNGNPSLTLCIRDQRPALLVENDGPVIPEAELDQLYELFFRGSNTRHIPGHGIGLALTRQILDFCQAHISIQSTLRQGTQVLIQF
ncbi:HAMP domain-containing sensor histidine kinase [Rhabdobacter roseus]|uniref:histidine kinase n=1 Tax=Rhabdobacter roseus TaxID=1655419 RepID=A0A840TFP7_9BACT|nr:HAMP domain-containing sensor histidine kinase [Rhabdobacter roseus]MBB5281991.1 signal transduction histidine kinase [Rhabdobacter roseus]